MNPLVPSEFKINGDVVIRMEQESLLMLGMMILIVVIFSLLAAKFIKKA